MISLICTQSVRICSVLVIVLFTLQHAKPCPPRSTRLCLTKDCVAAAARILSNINMSVDPCNDFYSFNCDGWMKEHHIADDQGAVKVFKLARENVKNILRDILSEPVSAKDTLSTQKIKLMYHTCLNEGQVFATTKPQVMNILKQMGQWPLITPNWTSGTFDWIKIETGMWNNPSTPGWITPLIGLVVDYDFTRNTSEKRITLTSVPFGVLREFLVNSNRYWHQITAYKNLITGVAMALGNQIANDIVQQVNDVVAFESTLAHISSDPAILREKDKVINMSLAELAERTNASVPWVHLLQLIFNNITEITESEKVLIYDESYVFQIGKLIEQTDKKILANYMIWKFLLPILIHIDKQTQSLYYDFSLTVSGSGQTPRWKVCIDDVEESVGMALGREYIQREFAEDTKTKITDIIARIKRTFTTMLQSQQWLDDKTRQTAVDKAMDVQFYIGYPDWILNNTALEEYYQDVVISPSEYFLNLQIAAKALVRKDLKSLRVRPADKTNLGITPQTVNAYYFPNFNLFSVPAAILKEPFVYPNGIMALNYGGIGFIAGHEITHAFDSSGKKYNKDGVLSDWWTQQSTENFGKRAECFVNQYDKFCPSEHNSTLCVDGNLTLTENIADSGGLKAAFKAYQEWLKQNGGEEKRLPGLQKYSGEQLFFMSFAQLWCIKAKPAYMTKHLLMDTHTPGRYRVNGVVANSPDFQRVFRCNSKPNTQVCELW